MNSHEINEASDTVLRERQQELESMHDIESRFPENMELQLIKQRLDGYQPPIYRPILGGGTYNPGNGQLEVE